ncbi:hypothetical protein B9Y66_12175 [Stenotrophomonas maltophilia]|nr:hypothetical protein B9Y66_12175 [Stenotrophomonas maltophilia]
MAASLSAKQGAALALGEGGGRCVVAIPVATLRKAGGHEAPTHRPPKGTDGLPADAAQQGESDADRQA